MAKIIGSYPPSNQTTLQKILTTAVNELGVEATLVAIATHEEGPLTPQVSRGFTAREIGALLRSLPEKDWGVGQPTNSDHAPDARASIQLRMVTPGSKVLFAVPMQRGNRVYGTLVVGRRENTAFSKRDKSSVEQAAAHITEELQQRRLFGTSLILGQSMVAQEPISEAQTGNLPTPRVYSTPDIQHRITCLLNEQVGVTPFDRAWVVIYDPLVASMEILGIVGGQKRGLTPGQHLSLDESASGWAVRHRKPRYDSNLASTQGRFHDYKQLYKDRFASTVVVPFFVRGRVAGTVTFASKTPSQYDSETFQVSQVESVLKKLVELFKDPTANLSVLFDTESTIVHPPSQTKETNAEPTIRKEERRMAIQEVSSFLATEIREPMGFIRAQLEEITTEAHLDFDSQTRVETAMRDLIRMEAVLHEILDFTKPMELDQRLCRIPEILDQALSLISTDLRVNRINVTKQYPTRLPQVRWDEAKMQHAILGIFKNSLEAMSPGGHLRVGVSLKKRGKTAVVITIENDGLPIPSELVEKVLEPYFTTKRSGTGLGLAMVKKIVEEHQGQIHIASGPDQGTTVTLQLPTLRPRSPYWRKRVEKKPKTPS